MKLQTGILATIAAGAGYVTVDRFRRRSWIDLAGKVVLITGGSRGLGLATAREFGSRGAVVAICARDEMELSRAQADLTARGVRSQSFVCDITDRNQVVAMVADATRRLGPIDILVNNAGMITVGPFCEMDTEDFERAMNVMFWGPLHMTQAVLPAMRARKRGSIVNITSIGGKVSVPHLLPYCCAKFAAVALSEGLRTELAPAGIRVTTIVPGLLRTGSHLNAEFKGKLAREYAWFAAGAATPLVSISAERAARSIVRATVRGDSEVILSAPADVLARLHGIAPGVTVEVLSIAARLLPSDGGSTEAKSGYEIESEMNSRLWNVITTLGQKAAESLNQIPMTPAGIAPSLS
jgi:NAD(P)-dependent dehydrogenase (short-subunit alcohol dehydrogenase family)